MFIKHYFWIAPHDGASLAKKQSNDLALFLRCSDCYSSTSSTKMPPALEGLKGNAEAAKPVVGLKHDRDGDGQPPTHLDLVFCLDCTCKYCTSCCIIP